MGRTKCAATNSESLTLTPKNGKSKLVISSRIGQHVVQKTGFEGRLDTPLRKTVCPFGYRYTLVHTTSKETKKQPQLNKLNPNNGQEKGRQIYWAKSLEGIRAMVPLKIADKFSPNHSFHITERLELPPRLEIMTSNITEEQTAASAAFCTALHTFDINGAEMCGKQEIRKQIEENPFEMVLKFTKPYDVQIPSITEQDIAFQERRVLDARKRLHELRKSFLIR